MDELRAHNATLRAQLEAEREANRENRRIIAALTQRIPELEPPREPESVAEEPDGRSPGPLQRALRTAPARPGRGGAECSVDKSAALP